MNHEQLVQESLSLLKEMYEHFTKTDLDFAKRIMNLEQQHKDLQSTMTTLPATAKDELPKVEPIPHLGPVDEMLSDRDPLNPKVKKEKKADPKPEPKRKWNTPIAEQDDIDLPPPPAM